MSIAAARRGRSAPQTQSEQNFKVSSFTDAELAAFLDGEFGRFEAGFMDSASIAAEKAFVNKIKWLLNDDDYSLLRQLARGKMNMSDISANRWEQVKADTTQALQVWRDYNSPTVGTIGPVHILGPGPADRAQIDRLKQLNWNQLVSIIKRS